MTFPLFPLPQAEDLRLDCWGASGRERILIRADTLRPSRRARQAFGRNLELGGRTCECKSFGEYDHAFCEAIVRAWLASHRAVYRNVIAARGVPAESLDYFLLRGPLNGLWRSAIAHWLDRLVIDPLKSTSDLTDFTPRRYVLHMCRLIGVRHPFDGDGERGYDQALAEGFFSSDVDLIDP